MFIGVDPGLDGALAVIGEATRPLQVLDAPTLTAGRRREYDLARMATMLRPYRGVAGDLLVVIEQVHAMPGQGVRSMFSMGYGLGVWEGILAGLGLPYERVTPQRWKRAMLDGMDKGKEASRLKAIRLFPSAAGLLARKKDHGRAEALLIAEYGRRTHGQA